jgi:hypothetical protein
LELEISLDMAVGDGAGSNYGDSEHGVIRVGG